ncbi:NAD(P)/FAD-dependent oxidoreductase [Streptomyces aculeolatus]|uniref:NAD(P)/FAD-dependent oxidoreductase n=1 Tax=Streptomyces aculeolatus TaxID=270689 RepID=UPI001CED3DCC|nr:FAD-binding oxidoreductase [Streptomyces aculeolatus]
MTRRIVIVGAGIVGSSLARELAGRDGCQVTVLDRSPAGRLYGSTGHAPGYVGVLGEAPVLTGLARATVRSYREITDEHDLTGGAGFEETGCLEVATTPAAYETLARRAAAAEEEGLAARLVGPAEAAALAPRLVDPETAVAGLYFPGDGTARAGLLTAAQRRRAEARGARFADGAEAAGLEIRAGRVHGVWLADGTLLPADDTVLASGIWGPLLAARAGVELPLTPVSHPYVYGGPHQARHPRGPFVRWPEHHAYARDHGDRDGIGTYDHVPLPVAAAELGVQAEEPWPGEPFDGAVAAALALLPPGHRFTPAVRLNGVFSVTPDNLPLLGPFDGLPGLWSATAVWVTHAAGAAAALAEAMDGGDAGAGFAALAPDRFAGEPAGELRRRALRHYRDIYAAG